jgi:nucleotide-binding universal stress UspA family protein
VGFDGSAESRAALAAAESLALTVGGALRVFCVLPSARHPSDASGLSASVRDQMVSDLHEATRALAPEVRALPVTLEGAAGQELIERSDEVEVMVLGSRGRGRLRSVMLGSVAEALLSGAKCPVIVVPRADDVALSAPRTSFAVA